MCYCSCFMHTTLSLNKVLILPIKKKYFNFCVVYETTFIVYLCSGDSILLFLQVQRNANPPVCKLMDFHREKYKQQLKEKDRAKSKVRYIVDLCLWVESC